MALMVIVSFLCWAVRKVYYELRVYSVPQGDWTLELDGTEIGGIACDISKTYFESALARRSAPITRQATPTPK